jgi:hypothetical protein
MRSFVTLRLNSPPFNRLMDIFVIGVGLQPAVTLSIGG